MQSVETSTSPPLSGNTQILTGELNSFSMNPSRGQKTLVTLDVLPSFVTNLTSSDNPTAICNATISHTISNVEVAFRANPIACAPFMVVRLIRMRAIRSSIDLLNFVSLSNSHGAKFSARRYDMYAKLSFIDDKDPSEKLFEDELKTLQKEDAHALEFNDVEAWTAALRNWLYFWDLIIVFKDSILAAALSACDRFAELMQQYNYGIKSPDTQRALSMGSVYFSKQIMDAMALGYGQGETGVISALAQVPNSEIGTTMAEMLNNVMLRNATRPINDTNKPVAKPKVNVKPKAPASGGRGRGGGKAAQPKAAASPAAAPTAAATTQSSPGGSGSSPSDKDLVCTVFLSSTTCTFGKQCRYAHRYPTDKEEMEKAIHLLKQRGLECSNTFGAKCDKAGVDRD
jgi:hypothetical protein